MSQLNQCHICYQWISHKGTIICRHVFCFGCIQRWSKQKNTCPICRTKFEQITETYYRLRLGNVSNLGPTIHAVKQPIIVNDPVEVINRMMIGEEMNIHRIDGQIWVDGVYSANDVVTQELLISLQQGLDLENFDRLRVTIQRININQ